MAFDYKKEYRSLYLPKQKPLILEVPPMRFAAVRGMGDPNDPKGAYRKSISILYAIAYTIKMSKKGDRAMEGYFDFVVPPLEGFWWQRGIHGMDHSLKDRFEWISCIRLPEFVTQEHFEWARTQAARKKKIDVSSAELLFMEEGLCVHAMHLGPYDDEPETVAKMDAFIVDAGYENDMSDTPEGRHHHEIYLSDPRRTAPEKLKTVIRHPIRKLRR